LTILLIGYIIETRKGGNVADLKTLECDTCGYTIQVLEKDIWHERCPNCAEMGTWKDRKENDGG